MLRILFVCTGNTCRSPLAEGMLRHMLQREQIDAEVRSAGVSAVSGSPISSHSSAILKEAGIQDNLTSRALDQTDIEWADLILTMTMGHKATVIHRHPYAVEKIFTLKEFVEDDPDMLAAAEVREKLAVDLQMKQALSQPITDEERTRMARLNRSISDYDISDPFGGSLNTYRITADEIELYLKKLLIKLQGYGSDQRDR
jgi:protein-tyrosine-phosphatase